MGRAHPVPASLIGAAGSKQILEGKVLNGRVGRNNGGYFFLKSNKRDGVEWISIIFQERILIFIKMTEIVLLRLYVWKRFVDRNIILETGLK